MSRRRTLARQVRATGTALHAGVPVTMVLSPAQSGQGVVFRRTDLGVSIPARYDQVSETRLGTVIGEGSAKVGVVEHLMAAAAGLEIDDLTGFPGWAGAADPGRGCAVLSRAAGQRRHGRAGSSPHGGEGPETRDGGKRRCQGMRCCRPTNCPSPMS